MEDKLETILKHVNDWLKFAEQKNATLLALDAGTIWGVSKLLNDTSTETNIVFILSSTGYFFLIVSIAICLTAFMPVLTNVWFKCGDKNTTDNALYFGDIAKYTPSEYLAFLRNKLRKKSSVLEWELDYSNQITNNASIALEKYKRYTLASWFFFIAMMVFLFAIGIKYIG